MAQCLFNKEDIVCLIYHISGIHLLIHSHLWSSHWKFITAVNTHNNTPKLYWYPPDVWKNWKKCMCFKRYYFFNKENFLCLFYGQKNVLNNRKLFCFIHVHCITFNFGSRKIHHEFVYTLNFNHVDCKTFLKMIYLMFNSGSLLIVQVI